jgi:diol dehydratase reactivase alpha subunit
MTTLAQVDQLKDVQADSGSFVAEMFRRMKEGLANLTTQESKDLKIKDLLAIDTFVPVKVRGALANEVAMEKAVAIAAMVKTEELPMERLAREFGHKLKIPVALAGVEAVMASIGALTTPGTRLPIAILDLGGGSTDAAILLEDGNVNSIHMAGAGEFVTMMINEELALDNMIIAEWIKRYPLAKVNSLYHMTMENGEVVFFKQALDPKLYARVILVKEEEYIPLMYDLPLEKILTIRRQVKEKVFIDNALRALSKIAPKGNIRNIPNVVLVGGSSLDFEIPEMIQTALANYNIVAGRGDVQGHLGPRNAVATGLCMTYDSGGKV